MGIGRPRHRAVRFDRLEIVVGSKPDDALAPADGSRWPRRSHDGGTSGGANAIRMGAGALRHPAQNAGEQPVIFGNRRCTQRDIPHHLFPQRRDRPRQTDGACRRAADDRPKPSPTARPPSVQRSREHHEPRLKPRMPILEAVEPVKLRCADIDPRHLSLADLQAGDCRYPYGGDEALDRRHRAPRQMSRGRWRGCPQRVSAGHAAARRQGAIRLAPPIKRCGVGGVEYRVERSGDFRI